MTAHTPGPWIARQFVNNNWEISTDEGAHVVARTSGEGNARLLEAAPLLLAAARAMFDVMTVSGKHSYRPDSETGRAIEATRAAIAAAEGR